MFATDQLIDDLCTHGYHIIDNFFELAQYQQLRAIAIKLQQEGVFQSAKIGAKTQAQQNSTVRNDAIYWLDEVHNQPSIQCYLQRMNDIITQLNHSLFLGLHEFETHFAIYPPGSFYKKHVDQFQTTKTRKISCVYYLNEEWSASFGGALKLYSKQDELLNEVNPIGNRFICFNSELPHEVIETQRTRYSITGWMKTRAASDNVLL